MLTYSDKYVEALPEKSRFEVELYLHAMRLIKGELSRRKVSVTGVPVATTSAKLAPFPYFSLLRWSGR